MKTTILPSDTHLALQIGRANTVGNAKELCMKRENVAAVARLCTLYGIDCTNPEWAGQLANALRRVADVCCH